MTAYSVIHPAAYQLIGFWRMDGMHFGYRLGRNLEASEKKERTQAQVRSTHAFNCGLLGSYFIVWLDAANGVGTPGLANPTAGQWLALQLLFGLARLDPGQIP